MRDYQSAVSPQKQVDFCVYLEPEVLGEAGLIDDVRNLLPEQSLNHTAALPVRHRPIAFSIETKKTGEGAEAARLQIGVWLAAQWRFLEVLAGLSHGEDRVVLNTSPTSAVDTLPLFLPGIVIQGHDWNLYIATQENGNIVSAQFLLTSPRLGVSANATQVLWSKIILGSTNSAIGICQIVSVLHFLRKWAVEEYWPWFKNLIRRPLLETWKS